MDGELNVSRSIGGSKSYVSADCDFSTFEIDYDYDCLVMCSDGLLEKMTAEEVASEVRRL